MPPSTDPGQPDSASAWFGSETGRVLLECERPGILNALAERPGQPWLWLGPVAQPEEIDGRGLSLAASGHGWNGVVRCALPLPLANEMLGVVVLQHVAPPGRAGRELLAECARVLAPGGRLWLYALNPLSPFRWRWRGSGLRASEPLTWRRRLRETGFEPEPVSQGIGPNWRLRTEQTLQHGPGVRAAYAVRAEKRAFPLTPIRRRAPLRLPEGVPAR